MLCNTLNAVVFVQSKQAPSLDPSLPLFRAKAPISAFCEYCFAINRHLLHTFSSLVELSPSNLVHLYQQFPVGYWVSFRIQEADESVSATQPVKANARPG